MLRSAYLVGTTAFWLTMMSLLIQREFFHLAPVKTALEVLPLYNSSVREEYQAIYLGNRRVGFSFTVLESLAGTKAGKQLLGVTDFELRHQTYMSFRLLGNENEMLIRGKTKLNEQLYLKSFELKISSRDYWSELKGDISDSGIHLTVEGKNSPPASKTIPVQDPVLYSESMDLIWTPENLRLGKRGRLLIWNPLLADLEETEFWVSHKESIHYQEEDREVFVIVMKRGEVELKSWVSAEGMTLRRESPTGLLFQKEEPWQIFDAMRDQRNSLPDLPNLFSVPSNQILENPENLNWLKAIVKSGRESKTLEIERVNLEELKGVKFPLENLGPEMAPYLEASEWIQTQDPALQSKAKEIIGPEVTALGAILKLTQWVHAHVRPFPTVTLPSAKEVLVSQRGDCNEYTALFTALARSLGIPTKMIAGLVYRDGRFFYHAWAEVYLGKWVGVDPTFNEVPTFVTHIPLVEGNLQEQVKLANQLGKTSVIILESV